MWVTVAIVVWVLLVMAAKSASSNAMAEPLVFQMRSIAQQPVPKRDDPRFKEWKDIRTQFPPPSGGRHGFPGEDRSPEIPIKAAGAWLWRPLGRVCGLAWRDLRRAILGRKRYSGGLSQSKGKSELEP